MLLLLVLVSDRRRLYYPALMPDNTVEQTRFLIDRIAVNRGISLFYTVS